jgi:hypothetical protein
MQRTIPTEADAHVCEQKITAINICRFLDGWVGVLHNKCIHIQTGKKLSTKN